MLCREDYRQPAMEYEDSLQQLQTRLQDDLSQHSQASMSERGSVQSAQQEPLQPEATYLADHGQQGHEDSQSEPFAEASQGSSVSARDPAGTQPPDQPMWQNPVWEMSQPVQEPDYSREPAGYLESARRSAGVPGSQRGTRDQRQQLEPGVLPMQSSTQQSRHAPSLSRAWRLGHSSAQERQQHDVPGSSRASSRVVSRSVRQGPGNELLIPRGPRRTPSRQGSGTQQQPPARTTSHMLASTARAMHGSSASRIPTRRTSRVPHQPAGMPAHILAPGEGPRQTGPSPGWAEAGPNAQQAPHRPATPRASWEPLPQDVQEQTSCRQTGPRTSRRSEAPASRSGAELPRPSAGRFTQEAGPHRATTEAVGQSQSVAGSEAQRSGTPRSTSGACPHSMDHSPHSPQQHRLSRDGWDQHGRASEQQPCSPAASQRPLQRALQRELSASFAFSRQDTGLAEPDLGEVTARLPTRPSDSGTRVTDEHGSQVAAQPVAGPSHEPEQGPADYSPQQARSRRSTAQAEEGPAADGGFPADAAHAPDQAASRRTTAQPAEVHGQHPGARRSTEQQEQGSPPGQLQQVQAELAVLQQKHLAALQELQALQSDRLR